MFGLPGTFVCQNAEGLDRVLPNAAFDLIYSFGVIHHTPNPRAVIEAARKLIRPDGELRIMVYARHSWKAIMIEEGFDQPEAQSGCPIALTYTPDDARTLLDGLFEVTEVGQAHIFPYVVEKYVKYEYEPHPWFKSMPPELFQALERHLGWHLLVVARPV
jgi:SAM-dependent methyltransferase